MIEGQIVTPQQIAEKAVTEAQEILSRAKGVVIQNDDDYRIAGAEFVAIKNRIKDLENQRVAITKPMDAAKAAVMDLFRRPKEVLEAALAFREKPMAAYQQEKERLRRDAEAAARRETERLQREAREREREERERLAEIQRQEDEARRLAVAAPNPMAAFLAKQKVEELAQAATEQTTVVTNTIREAVTVQAVVDFVPKATAAGTSARTNWKFRIVNPDLIPRNYMTPNEPEIGAMVRMLKDKDKAEATIPGIEVFSEITIGGR